MPPTAGGGAARPRPGGPAGGKGRAEACGRLRTTLHGLPARVNGQAGPGQAFNGPLKRVYARSGPWYIVASPFGARGQAESAKAGPRRARHGKGKRMSNRLVVFLIRAVVGFLGGWVLTYFFFTGKGQPISWFIVVVLAALVVVASYLSEAVRLRQQQKK